VLYCWWPVHGQKMKAKKSEEPKDTWLDFKVRLLSAKPYSTYGKADRLAFTACETSNIESETENEKETGPGKRKKQLRMKTCSMGCSGGLIRDIIIGGAEPS
ncbi:hypothetical protein CAPTEDRAFT_194678, partial [Capitella teleta]